MKNRVLVIPERLSRKVTPIQFAVMCPPPSFVRTEIMTVFPDLQSLCEKDKRSLSAEVEAANTRQQVQKHTDTSAHNQVSVEGATESALSVGESKGAGDAGGGGGCDIVPHQALSSAEGLSSNSSLSSSSFVVTPTTALPPHRHTPFANIAGLPPNKAIFVITTFQPCDCDNLTAFTDDTAQFKDWSRERFLDFMSILEERLGIVRDAEHVKKNLHREEPRVRQGEEVAEVAEELTTPYSSESASIPRPSSSWWVDYPDPASGIPIHTQATSTAFCESDAIELLLKMELMYVNGCRMVVHPKFKENVYPCSAVIYGGGAEELAALLEGI